MRPEQVAEVHAVQLVAGQDQHFVRGVFGDVADLLADGVGGALIPVGGLVGLLGGQHLDEAAAEGVELVGVGDVAVQADAEELRQDVDAVQPLLMQLLMGMSMRRYLPATGTAGLLRSWVSGYSRVPRPPPRMRLRTSCMTNPAGQDRSPHPHPPPAAGEKREGGRPAVAGMLSHLRAREERGIRVVSLRK